MVKNNNRSNQQKSNFVRVGHFFCIFLCLCFARLLRETSRNFIVTRCMGETSYVFSFTFLSLPLFSFCVGGRQHFPFCHRRYEIFMLFFQQKNVSFVLYLSPFLSLSFAGLPPTFSFSLSFSCSIFQICGHDNQSKLNTLANTDTETISAFRFRLH